MPTQDQIDMANYGYLPIASKSFGTDTSTGLEKKIVAWKQSTNTKIEIIEVTYDVVLISPTGKIVSILSTDQYTRYNSTNNTKFDTLRASVIGQGIASLIQTDLQMIQSPDSIKQDLLQLV